MEELEREQMNEIIDCIKNNDLYDYIASNYWRIEDDLIIQLLKECIYTLEERQMNKLLENLEEFEEWEVK